MVSGRQILDPVALAFVGGMAHGAPPHRRPLVRS